MFKCFADCCVISFLIFHTLQEEILTKFKIELRQRIKGEFQFFYAISIETMQLTIILMVLQSLFAFVVHCCIISFLTHCIHRAKEKKGRLDERRRDERRRRRWVSILLCYFHSNNATNHMYDGSTDIVCVCSCISFLTPCIYRAKEKGRWRRRTTTTNRAYVRAVTHKRWVQRWLQYFCSNHVTNTLLMFLQYCLLCCWLLIQFVSHHFKRSKKTVEKWSLITK